MKKLLVIFLIFVFTTSLVSPEVFAAGKEQVTEISKIENDIFGFDYINDELKKRVERLETTIYGKVSSGDLAKRIDKLASDLLSSQIGLQIEPSEDTFLAEENLETDSGVNYPIVDEIEKKIFNQTFKNRDFHSRIVAIERKLFNKIYDVDDYSVRMDRIKAEVMPERLAREKVFGYDNTDPISSIDLSALNANRYSSMPYGQENYTRPYANYGDLLGGASPVSGNLNDDLAQLEYDTFGTEFSSDDADTRIKRLNSANKAKKSSQRYDSNKFNQRMSTVMEIGAMLLMILAMVL